MNIQQFCNEWLNAWSGNQPEQLLAYYSENTFYSDPAFPNGLSGKTELKNYFTKLLAANPNWKWEAVEIFSTAKGFTLKWRATVPVKNQTISFYGLDIVELEGNKISRNEVYFDRYEWLKLLGK